MELVAQKTDDDVQRAAKLYIHIQEHYKPQWSPTTGYKLEYVIEATIRKRT